jgi:two-component system chemotaxis response regulator CheB
MSVEDPRVLIVDDSAVVRGLLARGLEAQGLQVVGQAGDPFEARDLIVALRPDVLTLDVEMPRMDGLSFLERLMAFHPMPVILLSSLGVQGGAVALRAMELGALEVLAKPGASLAPGAKEAGLRHLAELLRAVAGRRVRPRWSSGLAAQQAARKHEGGPARSVMALGASTGGTQALSVVLGTQPAPGAGALIVQHMPPQFVESFAARLDAISPWRVSVARHGQPLREGEALIAPGDRHLALFGGPGTWHVRLKDSPPLHGVRPSADVLLQSAAQACGPRAVGAVLTGMGRDGAAGLLAMRQAGAWTLAQDEASSVVYGMPREAWLNGAAQERIPLDRIGPTLRASLEALESTTLDRR